MCNDLMGWTDARRGCAAALMNPWPSTLKMAHADAPFLGVLEVDRCKLLSFPLRRSRTLGTMCSPTCHAAEGVSAALRERWDDSKYIPALVSGV